ncbi:gametogenetin-binding protein 2 [Dendropsophus ebraccatus]|uniref:gametogenetin-binding protein 2 n=1 Tax=Dendropsophus ebraccatus TaxID=150705 RepID=UPI00383162C4
MRTSQPARTSRRTELQDQETGEEHPPLDSQTTLTSVSHHRVEDEEDEEEEEEEQTAATTEEGSPVYTLFFSTSKSAFRTLDLDTMTVEKVQGISRLEQLCEEFLEEERVQELKQEKKRQKKKNRRKNKCTCAIAGEQKERTSEKDDPSGYMEMGCSSCSGLEDHTSYVEAAIASETSPCSSCTCPSCSSLLASPNIKKGGYESHLLLSLISHLLFSPSLPDQNPFLWTACCNHVIRTVLSGLTACSNGSDCGYSSSMEGSEFGSREGSDVACTEGICNHDEAGEDHCGVCEKDDEDGDSCVECWANSAEDSVKDTNRRRKKKCKPFVCRSQTTLKQGLGLRESSSNGQGVRCCSTVESMLQPCPGHRQPLSQPAHTVHSPNRGREPKSLKELLDESECTSEEDDWLSQEEIQAFMVNNQSFYSKRQQFRQYLKEKFNKYCLLHDHRNARCSSWLATAGAF